MLARAAKQALLEIRVRELRRTYVVDLRTNEVYALAGTSGFRRRLDWCKLAHAIVRSSQLGMVQR